MGQVGTALVIGATGGIGGKVARALHSRGWRVRALHHDPERVRAGDASFEWVRGDALDAASVVRAAEGARLIVHGANPPGYRNWKGLALPMLESTLVAAAAGGARVLFPGTVYNFGADAGDAVDETAPQNRTTHKGAIRVAMERRLESAASVGVRTLVVRAGDFFGPRAGNNFVGPGHAAHAGAGEAGVRPRTGRGRPCPGLPARPRRGDGPPARAGGRACGLRGVPLRRRLGRGQPRVRRRGPAGGRTAEGVDPSLPVADGACAGAVQRDVPRDAEMAYLWRRLLRLKDGKLRRFLGDVPEMPLDVALRATLRVLGRLDVPASVRGGVRHSAP